MDAVKNLVRAVCHAGQGTLLGYAAILSKYCLFMGIPFVGWTIIEIFFCILRNPFLFAAVWLLITLIGLIADYINPASNVAHRNPLVTPTFGSYNLGLEVPLLQRILPNMDSRDPNNNHHDVDITALDGEITVPDAGTQTSKTRVNSPDSPPSTPPKPNVTKLDNGVKITEISQLLSPSGLVGLLDDTSSGSETSGNGPDTKKCVKSLKRLARKAMKAHKLPEEKWVKVPKEKDPDMKKLLTLLSRNLNLPADDIENNENTVLKEESSLQGAEKGIPEDFLELE